MRFLLAALLLVVPSIAFAQPPSRDTVRSMLMGYEQVPSAAQWQALGPETLGVLVSLYDDAAQPPFVRLRAVGAVAAFPTPAARTFLLAVARANGQGDLMIREAVLALGRAFGAAARIEIRTFLTHREPVVREAAATALQRIDAAARGSTDRSLRRRAQLRRDRGTAPPAP
jgi:hypothetical protein